MNNDAEERLAEQQRRQQVNSNVQAKQNAKTADALRTASNIASNTSNPYAKAIGTAVKTADKVSGGKSTEALGNVLNKTAAGRIAGHIGSNALAKTAANTIAAKNGSGSSNMPKPSNSAALSNKKNNTNEKNNNKKAGKDSKNGSGFNKQNNDTPSELDDEAELQEKKKFASDVFFVGVGAPVLITAASIIVLFLPVIIMFIVITSSVSDTEEKMNTIMQSDAYLYAHAANPTLVIADIMYSAKTGNDVGIVSKFKDLKEKFGSLKLDMILNIGNNFNTKDENGVCEGTNCSSRVEVLFTQKAMDINSRYKKLYGIDLDWPLIISTIIINSDDKAQTFSDNVSDYDRKDIEKKDVVMPIDWEYDYKNIPGYSYLAGNDSRYDMQILAKNMVKKTTTQTCKDKNGKDLVEPLVLEDVEDSLIDEKLDNGNYLECKNGTYKINSTYKLDKDKYDEFLDEYIEMKYFVNKYGTYYAASNGSGSGSGSGGTGYDPSSNPMPNVNIGNDNYGWPLENMQIVSQWGAIRGSRPHLGTDLKASIGTPVYAIADGVVLYANNSCVSIPNDKNCGGGFGNYVTIDHGKNSNGDKMIVIYGHADRILVNVGDTVVRGQHIMYSGNTGHVLPVPTPAAPNKGQHLHIELRLNSIKNSGVDIMPYIGG